MENFIGQIDAINAQYAVDKEAYLTQLENDRLAAVEVVLTAYKTFAGLDPLMPLKPEALRVTRGTILSIADPELAKQQFAATVDF